MPKISLHWVLYSLLIIGLGAALWIWHTTKVNDTAAMQAVTSAKANQATVDKQVTTADSQAQAQLQQNNAALQAQLTAAKTLAQQVALLNKNASTNLSVQPTPTPSGQKTPPTDSEEVLTPVADIPVLVKQSVDFKEAQNQIATDQVTQANCVKELDAANQTVSADDKEITALKGGSRLQRFFKAVKNDAIVGGIGIGVGVLVAKKVN